MRGEHGRVVQGDQVMDIVVLVHNFVGAHVGYFREHQQIEQIFNFGFVCQWALIPSIKIAPDLVEFLKIAHDASGTQQDPGELKGIRIAETFVSVLGGSPQNID